LQDNNHRTINYLRLSVTDRCNLRCIYCMAEEGVHFVPHAEILTYEEMHRVVNLCVQQGIRKVRITGGEPLVRKGIVPFIQRLCRIDGLEEIALTTNGVLLKDFARALRGSGICRINVSMDTLRPERFRQITRRDDFDRVWEGIQEAEAASFNPIKINVVAIRGMNDDEVLDFARLTFTKPYHVRFIEVMPVGEKNAWTPGIFLPVHEILDTIRTLGPINPVDSKPLDGPAERYALEGAQGEIGLIGALSHHFCEKCNRLRLTADGRLRGCLFSDQEGDIKGPLRRGKDDGYLLRLMADTILNKPRDHGLTQFQPRKCVRSMNSIGG
jgi:cyclic pyranopterin phosphate synthase